MPIDEFFQFDGAADLIAGVATSETWTAAVRGGVDTATERTWDRNLRRTSRIMVPIDVQAFVVPGSGGEETVTITGGTLDPEPFAAGAVRPSGVHVHWAMPDAMLRAADADLADDFVLPPLPDRWVVLRVLYPVGQRRPFVRGWVLDAVHGTVTALDGFTGDKATSKQESIPLDGLIGGGPLWTAAYDASIGRFGLHDALDDMDALREMAPQGLASDQATYVVAGWTTDRDDDPLDSGMPDDLDDLLADLGWRVDHEADLDHLTPDVASELRLADIEMYSQPNDTPKVEIVTPDRNEQYEFEDLVARQGVPVKEMDRVIVAPRARQYASLFHGMVAGVPVGGALPRGDDRPSASRLEVAVALDTDDVIAAFWSAALDASPTERRGIEQLAAAFIGGTINKLGTDDGLRDIEEREHADGFFALPGPPLPSARPDVIRETDSLDTSPLKVGRRGRSATAPAFGSAAESIDHESGVFESTNVVFGSMQPEFGDSQRVEFVRGTSLDAGRVSSPLGEIEMYTNPTVRGVAAPRLSEAVMAAAAASAESRTVIRPAPRMFRPAPPIIAIRGARPSLRHHGDGMFDDQGQLRCRFHSELGTTIGSLADAKAVLPTLGSGALPPEVITIAQEAILLTPWASRWLVAATAPNADANTIRLAEARMDAEMLRLYSADGRYDGTGVTTLSTAPRTARGRRARAAAIDSWSDISVADNFSGLQAAAELGRLSGLPGSPPSPVGVTAWRQPWVPLWLEWRVEVNGTDSLDGWQLDALDLQPGGSVSTEGRSFNFVGRSPIGRGMTKALHQSIGQWLKDETGRDANLSDNQIADLRRLESFLAPIDVASASLDGIREQLLGIDYVGVISEADDDDRPAASRPPMPLFGGTVRVVQMRLVDAFGRTLDVPVSELRTPLALEVKGASSSFRISPRLQHGSRWLLRLVDPSWDGDPQAAPEASVNQIDPSAAVNPVAGFLLPDHIDEALEMFDAAGNALGQLGHHEITGSVRWEPAPGRPLPPGAGPLQDLPATTVPMGRVASAVVRADIAQRNSGDDTLRPTETPLSAMLRAIDSTLWSVDTFAALGSPSVAGLIGRPIAVVRANLTLDIPDDLDEVRVTAPGGEAERQAAFDRLADTSFPVRLGDLQRSDDGLLGYFVDDDYDTFRVVNRTVVGQAPVSGRLRGHLGLLGDVAVPDVEAIDNPWIDDEDIIWMTPRSPRKLTLLMVPGGQVHLTSGVLPRKRLALQGDWISALTKIMPSVRVGPVLVDPEEIRLPKVNLLGDKQQFTRRTGPVTWRDDPIVAASQSALLPRMPHEIQEGWIRIKEDDATTGGAS